jgi:hypothetical protein
VDDLERHFTPDGVLVRAIDRAHAAGAEPLADGEAGDAAADERILGAQRY